MNLFRHKPYLRDLFAYILIGAFVSGGIAWATPDNVIVPANKGISYIKDNAGRLFPLTLVYTTDGAGNPIPLSSGGLAATANQGTPNGGGGQAWPVTDAAAEATLTGIALGQPTSRGQKTMANSSSVVIASDQTAIPITGSISVVNTANGNPGAAAPAQATQVGGSDGTNLRALKVSATGVLSTDGSATTQPISGTVAVSNFPGTQAVSGTITANQGGSWTNTCNAGTNLNTSLLALDSSVNGILLSQASTTSGQKGPLIQGAVLTSAPTYVTGQTSPLTLTTAGAVRVDASATTQPVSGTVNSVQSGTYTVQPGNTANTTPWLMTINQGGNSATVSAGGALKIDGSASTQPVSGTLTCNAGTGTLNVSVQNASIPVTQSGTWSDRLLDGSGNPITSQASSSQRALDVGINVSGVQVDPRGVSQGSTTSGQIGALMQGAVTTAAPTYTTAQTSPLSLDTAGFLRVVNKASGSTGAAVPATALQVAGSDGTNLQALHVTTAGNLLIEGDVASAAADAGNPLKIGGKFNSSLPAFTNGQRGDAQMNQFGEIAVRPRNKFSHVAGAATTTVKSGSGTLGSICINAGTASTTVSVFDNTAGSGTTIALIALASTSSLVNCEHFDVEFATGLTITTTVAATDITVTYQ